MFRGPLAGNFFPVPIWKKTRHTQLLWLDMACFVQKKAGVSGAGALRPVSSA